MAGLQLEPWAFDTAPVTETVPGTMSGGEGGHMRGGGEAADTHWPLFMLVLLLFRKQNKTKQKTHHVQTLFFFFAESN